MEIESSDDSDDEENRELLRKQFLNTTDVFSDFKKNKEDDINITFKVGFGEDSY